MWSILCSLSVLPNVLFITLFVRMEPPPSRLRPSYPLLLSCLFSKFLLDIFWLSRLLLPKLKDSPSFLKGETSPLKSFIGDNLPLCLVSLTCESWEPAVQSLRVFLDWSSLLVFIWFCFGVADFPFAMARVNGLLESFNSLLLADKSVSLLLMPLGVLLSS